MAQAAGEGASIPLIAGNIELHPFEFFREHGAPLTEYKLSGCFSPPFQDFPVIITILSHALPAEKS